MFRLFLPTSFLYFFLSLVSTWVEAEPRRIATEGNLIATVPDIPQWCASTVQVTVSSPTADRFTGDKIELQRLLGLIGLTLDEECPNANTVNLAGLVDGQGVLFSEAVTKASGWALSSNQAQENSVANSSHTGQSSAQQSFLTTSKSLTVVQKCDQLAAHPADPEAVAPGIADEQILADQVIEACEKAIREDKKTPRLAFQLARGYLVAGRKKDAINQLKTASQHEHGGALAYLGDMYLNGDSGIEFNPAKAEKYYSRAAAAGFAPAEQVLAEFDDHTEQQLSPSSIEDQKEQSTSTAKIRNLSYQNPKVIENILAGDLDAVPFNEVWVKHYLYEVASTIGAECNNKHFTNADLQYLKGKAFLGSMDMSESGALVTGVNVLEKLFGDMRNMGAGIERRLKEQRDAENTESQRMEEGIKDALVLLQEHKCGSRNLAKFSENLTGFIENKDAPKASAQELLNTCRSPYVMGSGSVSPKFCMCVVYALPKAAMTRAERKSLTSPLFLQTVQSLMERKENREAFANCR